MEYEIQYARLATAEKLPDRFLNIKVHENTDLSKSSMGEIFTFVEILTPWFPTAQIGQNIIQTFYDSYYQDGSTSDLVNFENALKKVNETLAQVTQNGETDWLGNLNSILGVVIDNKIHLSQTGKAEAYILRDGKVNHLTEGLVSNNNEPHPLNTFSNITSGELKVNDKLLIANPDLYKNISLENIRQIIAMSEPAEAIMQITKLLKKKKVSCINVLILNLMSAEDLAKLPVEGGNSTIYLDKPLESILSNFIKGWHGLILPIIKSLGRKSKKASSKSVDFTKNYLSTLKKKKETSEPLKKRDLFETEFIQKDKEDTLLNDEEINYSPELDVHYYNESQKHHDNKILNALSKIFRFIWGIIVKSWQFIFQLTKNKKTRPYSYILFAIILLIIIGLFINSKRQDSSNIDLNQAQATLKKAETDEQDAKAAVLSNDKDKAKILFSNAINEASKILSYPVVGDDAKNVINESYTELDKLTNTSRYRNLNPIITLANKADDFFVVSGKAVITSGNDIFSALISGGKPEKVASIPSGNGNIQFGIDIGESIYFYTSNQKVYEYQATNQQLTLVKIEGSWETANSAASYVGNIFLLDGVIGQIYKHTSSSSGFDAGQTYLTSTSVDLKNSNSIAVDGSVYVLKSTGDVLKLQKGRQQEFGIQNIPSPNSKIEKPIKIYTDSDTPSIYILDAGQKRILEFDKSGNFLHQYVIPDVGDISDFTVNIKAKKVWVLSDKNLYEIGI